MSEINRFACDISLEREPFLSTISASHRAYNVTAEASRLARDEELSRVSAANLAKEQSVKMLEINYPSHSLISSR